MGEDCRDAEKYPGPGEAVLAPLRESAAARRAGGLARHLSARGPDHDGLLDLASNDYLGLSRDPRLATAAIRAVRTWGTGATGSRLVSGTTTLHTRLESALADFAGAPAALVFSSGYLANLAAVTALAAALAGGRPARDGTPSAHIVSDAANHASLIDACRLARAHVTVTPHADVAAVERALASKSAKAAIVVTDAVFSVAGDLAPLAALHRVARAHGALLLVDEAHAFGVAGPCGRGGAYAAGIGGEPDVVRTVTLSKALAGQGGGVLGAPEVIETLIDMGRSFIFDTGLAPPSAGAALAALDVVRASPELAVSTRERARQIAGIAAGLGLDASPPDAAVVSITLGAPEDAVTARDLCAQHGVRVACFRPPSVPAARSCLRLAARPGLKDADLDAVSRALTAVRDHAARAVTRPGSRQKRSRC